MSRIKKEILRSSRKPSYWRSPIICSQTRHQVFSRSIFWIGLRMICFALRSEHCGCIRRARTIPGI